MTCLFVRLCPGGTNALLNYFSVDGVRGCMAQPVPPKCCTHCTPGPRCVVVTSTFQFQRTLLRLRDLLHRMQAQQLSAPVSDGAMMSAGGGGGHSFTGMPSAMFSPPAKLRRPVAHAASAVGRPEPLKPIASGGSGVTVVPPQPLSIITPELSRVLFSTPTTAASSQAAVDNDGFDDMSSVSSDEGHEIRRSGQRLSISSAPGRLSPGLGGGNASRELGSGDLALFTECDSSFEAVCSVLGVSGQIYAFVRARMDSS